MQEEIAVIENSLATLDGEVMRRDDVRTWVENTTTVEDISSAIIQISQVIDGWEYLRWVFAARAYELHGAEGVREVGRRVKRAYSTLMAWRKGYQRYLGPEADSAISEELTPSHHLKVVTAKEPEKWLKRAVDDNLNPVELYNVFQEEEVHEGKAEVVDAPAVCPSCGAEDVYWKSDPYDEEF